MGEGNSESMLCAIAQLHQAQQDLYGTSRKSCAWAQDAANPLTIDNRGEQP